MPDLTSLLSLLKSPKTALGVFLFSTSLLFFPFEEAGFKRPSFTTEYETLIVVAMFLSGALLIVELCFLGWRWMQKPLLARQRKKFADEVFLSLNLEELSLLWAMTQSGTKTIKGSFDSPIMIFLRQKGCLGLLPGPQSALAMHHYMPDDIYRIVRERGYDRFPQDFRDSNRFKDEVRAIVQKATDRWQ